MKQIPSQFIDDVEYDKLVKYKELNGLTWKDIMLMPIKKGGK